tara:strand:- start:312 stop:746 length:435 start_codon:yes stop_codon:yes gene_type:complete
MNKWYNYNIEFDNEYKGDLVNKHIISFITNRLKNINLSKIEHTIKITSYNSINITTEENLHGYAVIGLANHNKEHGDKSIKNFNYLLVEPRNIDIFFKEGEMKKPDWENDHNEEIGPFKGLGKAYKEGMELLNKDFKKHGIKFE